MFEPLELFVFLGIAYCIVEFLCIFFGHLPTWLKEEKNLILLIPSNEWKEFLARNEKSLKEVKK